MKKDITNKQVFIILLFVTFFSFIAEVSGHSQSVYNGGIITGIIYLMVRD
jgi:hypothetical protein